MRQFKRIEVRPIAGTLGAMVHGADLANLDEETFAEIRQAFLDHLVVGFPDQKLTPESHMAFARRFGELDIHPYARGLPDHPEVMPIIKEADDRAGNFGGVWHSDVTFYEKPALGSILHAREVPPYGGDTMFANMYLAYETLSDGLKQMLEGMTALHNASRSYGNRNSRVTERADIGSKSMQVKTGEDAEKMAEHPVVRTHPETGRKGLFVNQNFTQRFSGWSQADSQPLLDYLCRHATQEAFTCRFRWAKDMVLFWDNRCTQHNALNDYFGFRREMHRVTVCGDKPFLKREAEPVSAAA